MRGWEHTHTHTAVLGEIRQKGAKVLAHGCGHSPEGA